MDDETLSDYEEFLSEDEADLAMSLGGGEDNDDDDSAGFNASDADEAELDDDDLSFSQDLGKGGRKPYEVEYRVLDINNIIQAQKREIDQIASMFMIKDTDAAILLRHFGWNKERLIERYMDNAEKINLDAGVHDDPARPRMLVMDDFTCEICFRSAEEMLADAQNAQTTPGPSSSKSRRNTSAPTVHGIDTMALACAHRFCTDCYRTYLEQKIKYEGESRRIQCMEEKCNLIVDERTIGMIVAAPVFERYRSMLNRTYVDDASNLRWCPAPNCEHIIECNVAVLAGSSSRGSAKRMKHSEPSRQIVPTVKCQCGHSFCFSCGLEGHGPAVCDVVKMWVRKCEDDSETANWISANTKECPKCTSTIEKNGGCNHMTCRKCRFEWCWMCSGPWSEHGTSWYNCNRYDEKSGSEARDSQAKSRASLQRYLHYFNRFANHEQSARLDRDLYTRTEKKMEEMQHTSELTWIEVQFLKKAVDTVTECRMTLKWTYAMAYYLARTNMTDLFEDNQRDLERAVEDLSEQLEKPIEPELIPSLRQKVTDLTVYVQRRREIMLSDTAEGFAEGRWQWNVDF